MAPKKQNSGSSQPSSSYNNRRFVSAAAEELYNHFVYKKKSLIMEWGLRLNENLHRDGLISEFINKRNWDKFTDNPKAAVVPIVRKFCTNASFERVDNVVFARAKMVSFALEAINAYYGLESIENDDYTKYLSRKKTLVTSLIKSMYREHSGHRGKMMKVLPSPFKKIP